MGILPPDLASLSELGSAATSGPFRHQIAGECQTDPRGRPILPANFARSVCATATA